MKKDELHSRARKMGLNPIGKPKETIIRAIQRAEHNRDCYNRGESATCGQALCAWREDCK